MFGEKMKIYTKKGSKWLLINLVLVFIIIFPVKFDLFSRETPLQNVRGSNRKILDVFTHFLSSFFKITIGEFMYKLGK